MTEKLYYQLEYVRDFEAAVLGSCPRQGGTWEIRLDRTAFYPEGGGQPYDLGTINGVSVVAVHERNKEVIHITDGPLEVGTAVRGVIDWERRYRHMQLHSGEHLLSGLVHRQYGYDNVGFHMGKDEVTIDFNGVLNAVQVWELELLANRMIYEDCEIAVTWPSQECLGALDYRSKKELQGQVRIVEIPDADCCACCGTHVRRTGEIGMIKVTGTINYKGGVRLSLQCGLTALEDYERRIRQDQGISRLLSARQTELLAAVEKLKRESDKKEEEMVRLYGQLIELKVSGYEAADGPLLLFEETLPAIPMRLLCTQLFEQGKGGVVMVCAGSGDTYNYVIGSSVRDMRTLSRELNQVLGGRGGGSALMAQGTFHAVREEIEKELYYLVQSHKN